jgi:hypothetical protein
MYIYKWQMNNRYCVNFKIIIITVLSYRHQVTWNICYVLLIYLNHNFNNTYTDQTGWSRGNISDSYFFWTCSVLIWDKLTAILTKRFSWFSSTTGGKCWNRTFKVISHRTIQHYSLINESVVNLKGKNTCSRSTQMMNPTCQKYTPGEEACESHKCGI